MCETDELSDYAQTHYDEMPIVATPREVWSERQYQGELNIYTDSPHPLTVSVPCPPKGQYRYTLNITPLDGTRP